MSKVRTVLACRECGQQLAQWAGRCPGCSAWGTIEVVTGGRGTAKTAVAGPSIVLSSLEVGEPERRVRTGFEGIDRVLGGGLVPASVLLLAGEPGIGKSTLLLQLVANLSAAGFPCLLASGEESREQVAARAARLGIAGDSVSFVPGRELDEVLDAARSARPFLLAVDSIQTLRDSDATAVTGGPTQVRGCADALIGLAKQEGICVVMTGHVTKDGDLAGPKTLEHAVDVVLAFDGDPRNGHRMLGGGKNRYGQEGEIAWFEMQADGLVEIDPSSHISVAGGEAGSATALPLAGRRALAVEVQALVVPTESSPRRQVAGLDSRRFQLIAAVVERVAGVPLSRSDLYGASSGGIRIDDPGCDLAVAAALASAATGRPPPARTAFVGEISLTGQIRPVGGLTQRMTAAKARKLDGVISTPGTSEKKSGLLKPTTTVRDALDWAFPRNSRQLG